MKWKDFFADFVMYIISFVGIVISVYFIYFGDSLQRSGSTERLGEIVKFENSIKVRPKGAFGWFEISRFLKNEVFESDYLFSGDSSTAEIKTQAGDTISINPNSMIHLKKGENSKIDILVYEGDLDYKTSDGETTNVKKSQSISVSKKSKQIGAVSEKAKILEIKNEPEFKAQPAAIDIKESPVLALIAPDLVPIKVDTVAEDRWQWVPENRIKIEVNLASARKRFLGEPNRLIVTWPKTNGAINYKIEIYKGKSKTVILSRTTDKTVLSIPWTLTGAFRASVLKNELVSNRAPSSLPEKQKVFDFAVRPVDVAAGLKTVFPRANQLIVLKSSKTAVFLKWVKNKDFSDYAIELSRSKEFKGQKNSEIVTDSVADKSLDISKLPAGVWYWRVKGLAITKETQWSTTNKFNLVK